MYDTEEKLKQFWLDNNKDFEKLRKVINSRIESGNIYPRLDGDYSQDKAQNLIDKWTNNNKTMKLTEQNYKRLAQLEMCSEFRERLESYAPKILSNGSVEVSIQDVRDAREEADNTQRELLDDIFGTPFKNPYKVGDKIEVLRDGKNCTQHKEFKKAVKKGDIIEVSHFSTDPYGGKVVAVSTEGSVVYIEAYPQEFKLYKPQIEVGKWYGMTDLPKLLFFVKGLNENNKPIGYGFTNEGKWDDSESSWGTDDTYEAPKELVEQRLKEEAERRGFKKGVIIEPLNRQFVTSTGVCRIESYCHLDMYNKLWYKGGNYNFTIFENGKWAEVVEEEQETYKRGDRFEYRKAEYILCRVGNKNHRKINMVSLTNGNLWNDTIKVEDVMNITQREFEKLSEGKDFKKIN